MKTIASSRWCEPMNWEQAVAYALSLPDTELSTSYGQPAVKGASIGRAFLFPTHDTETSFEMAIDLDPIEILKESEPESYWQTSYYGAWPGVLIRYAAADE